MVIIEKTRLNIAVVIPVWNRPQLLLRAVNSILAQTYMPNEIIIIDDGSDDTTAEVIALLEREHPSVHTCYIDHCGLPGKVRNIGICLAQSDWISFLDSDDEWMPEKLALQAQTILKSHTYICHTKEIWIRNNKKVSQRSQKHNTTGFIFYDALHKCIVGPSTVLMYKQLFDMHGYFREDLEVAEDYELWLRMLAKEYVSYVETPMVIKHAGHGHQLSEKYTYIEKFRISALATLMKQTYFSEKQRNAAMDILEQKIKIWNAGAIKRGNTVYEHTR